MNTEPYYTHTDDGRLSYLKNFSAKIAGYETLLVIDPADVLQTQNDYLDFKVMLDYVHADKTHHHSVVQYKDHLENGDKKHTVLGALTVAPVLPVFTSTLKENIFGRNATLVAFIKKAKKYTPEIGKDLGIIAPGSGSNTNVVDNMARTAALKPDL